ncbi:MAG: putative toxin-antitoxin system toxin component, PIN family [Chroococcidiopsidaceae cyanobacterium CP_BM_RX_35]|nr:putative toxin-antitoxin system toxin component, PIN family [Chroococcidiopsidaceae cyanobacterium CP_BM_RX_35]
MVVDTNVLVSAVLKDKAPEAVILFIVERDDFEWIISTEILTEYKDVLSRPKVKYLEFTMYVLPNNSNSG